MSPHKAQSPLLANAGLLPQELERTWFEDTKYGCKGAVKWAIIVSLLLLVFCAGVAVYFLAVVQPRIIEKCIAAGLSREAAEGISGLRSSVFYIWVGQMCCFPLFVIWTGVLVFFAYMAYQLGVLHLLRRSGLRSKRNIEHSAIKTRNRPAIKRYAITVFIAFSLGGALLVYLTFGDPIPLCELAVAVVFLSIVVVFGLSYYQDWSLIRKQDPNLVLHVYSRKSTLGSFFYGLANILFLAFLIRAVIPVGGDIAFRMSDRLVVKSLTSLKTSPSFVRLMEEARKQPGGEKVFAGLPSEKDLSLREIYKPFVEPPIPGQMSLGKLALRWMFWISITLLALSLLVPMFIYNAMLRSGKAALLRILESTGVGIFAGFGLQWFFSILFLVPPPTVESTATASLVVFSLYATWTYSTPLKLKSADSEDMPNQDSELN